jgi:hypothetical protein
MTIDKNYFLTRLANGEDVDAIGEEIAAMMNAAMAEHNANLEAEAAKQAEAEKEAAKRDLIEELVEIIQELAILEGMDPDEMAISEEEIDQIVAAFNEMFATMRNLKEIVASLEEKTTAPKVAVKTTKITPTDEQILADFIKMFN